MSELLRDDIPFPPAPPEEKEFTIILNLENDLNVTVLIQVDETGPYHCSLTVKNSQGERISTANAQFNPVEGQNNQRAIKTSAKKKKEL